MENGQSINISMMRNTMMIPVNQIEEVSDHDAMARRIKNRERQRRYRARKRLLADLKKAQSIDLSFPRERNVNANDTLQEDVTRVHCGRDWKKDARRAHILKKPEIRSNSSYFPAPMLASADQATSFCPGVSIHAPLYNVADPSSLVLDNDETRKHIPSRRHWKVEARNKKS